MSSNYPKFSIIIPNYNNGKTLERALKSALNQSFKAHEIIVIDDGSTDDSHKILAQYKGKVKSIYQRNSGVSAARNRGAFEATGDWLSFLDADDTYSIDRLRLHAEWIKDEPDMDFLLGEQEARTPDGNLLSLFMKSSTFGRKLLSEFGQAERIPITANRLGDLIADGFSEIRTISVPKNKFVDLGGFPTEHKIGEDLHFFIRLYAKSLKGGVVPHILATYYIYEGSALRRDNLKTMQSFVSTLRSVSGLVRGAPSPIKEGYKKKFRHTNLCLAYAYLRAGRKADAIKTVVPRVLTSPGIESLKDFASICRGFHTKED